MPGIAEITTNDVEPQAATLMKRFDTTLRTLGYNLPSLLHKIDFQTVGVVISAVIFAIFVYDLVTYFFSTYKFGAGSGAHHGSTYSSYGRSLLESAADLWQQRDVIGLTQYLRNGRSLDAMETLTPILDSLASAIKKWEEENPDEGKEKKSPKSRMLL